MVKKYIYCDLSSQVMEIKEIDASDSPFVTALTLYKEYEELKPIVISGVKQKHIAGANLFSIIFSSPVTESVRYTSSNTSFGLSLTNAGFDGIVLVGHARKLSYLEIDNGEVKLNLCEQLRSSSPYSFSQIVSNLNSYDVLAIGEAGEKKVALASLYYNGEVDLGYLGLGAVFGEANLKGVVLKANTEVAVDEKLEKKCEKAFHTSIKLRHLKLYGNRYFLQYGYRFGFLPLSNYKYRRDPRVLFLTGRVHNDDKRVKLGNTCAGCRINCCERTESNVLLPRATEIMALGLNLGFFDLEKVLALTVAAREEGLSCVELGSLLAYLRTVSTSDYKLPNLKDASVEEMVRVIHLIGEKRGIGESCSLGLKAFPDAIQMSDGTAILCDLRGAELQSVFYSLGEQILCFPDLFYGLSYGENSKSKGSLAYYTELLAHLSLSSSIPPEVVGALIFKRFPIRYLARTRFGVRILIKCLGKERLKELNESITLYRELAGPLATIPEHFIKDPISNMDDDKTVAYNAIMFNYDVEVSRIRQLLSKLK